MDKVEEQIKQILAEELSHFVTDGDKKPASK